MRKLLPAFRAVFVFALVAAVVIPAVAFATSYTSTATFKVYLAGASRSYSGTNILYTATGTPSGTNPAATTYKVELYRDKLIDDYIGSKSFPRSGQYGVTWTNVGSGKYYFCFSKANDGITEKLNPVLMRN